MPENLTVVSELDAKDQIAPTDLGGCDDTGEVEAFLDNNYEVIAAITTNWRLINETVEHIKSDEYQQHFSGLVEEDIANKNPDLTPAQIARSSADTARITRTTLSGVLSTAKWYGQCRAIASQNGNYDFGSKLDASIEATLEEQADSPDAVEAIKLGQSLSYSYEAAYTNENILVTQLFEFIKDDISKFDDLYQYLTDDKTDIHDYDGLLFALARYHFDDSRSSFITFVAEDIRDNPQIYSQFYIRDMIDQAEASVDNRPLSSSQQWLLNIKRLCLDTDVDFDSLIEKFSTYEFDSLPQDLQAEIANQVRASSIEMENTWVKLLEPYRRNSRFELKNEPVPGENGHTVKPSRKRPKNGRYNGRSNGRTTERKTDPYAIEDEGTEQKIKSLFIAKKTPDGYVANEIKYSSTNEDAADLQIEALMSTPNAKSIIGRYNNPNDLRKMIGSIIANPMGNGVSAMKDQRVAIVDPESGSIKRKKVLHFSAQDSHGLEFSDTDESNRIRIFYVAMNGKLILLDIQHKTVAEKQRGTFTKS